MAKYQITDPNGSVYEVEAPDDASEEDILKYVAQNSTESSEESSQDNQAIICLLYTSDAADE